jgi:hypothetical protein
LGVCVFHMSETDFSPSNVKPPHDDVAHCLCMTSGRALEAEGKCICPRGVLLIVSRFPSCIQVLWSLIHDPAHCLAAILLGTVLNQKSKAAVVMSWITRYDRDICGGCLHAYSVNRS